MSFLKVSGTKIVDKDGNEVILRGAGLGGWMKYVLSIAFVTLSAEIACFEAWRTSFQVIDLKVSALSSSHFEFVHRLSWLRIPDS